MYNKNKMKIYKLSKLNSNKERHQQNKENQNWINRKNSNLYDKSK